MSMTSLALPPPGTGDCVMTQHLDLATGEYSITIDHADPRILIGADLLRQISEGPSEWFPFPQRAQVRLAGVVPYEDIYLGATLRIEGTNRTVIYRITARHDEHTYIGEWPD
jgi:hypothetical protein